MVTITRGGVGGCLPTEGSSGASQPLDPKQSRLGEQRGREALRNGLLEHLGLLVGWSGPLVWSAGLFRWSGLLVGWSAGPGPGPDLQRRSQRSSQPVPLLHFDVEAMRYRSD